MYIKTQPVYWGWTPHFMYIKTRPVYWGPTSFLSTSSLIHSTSEPVNPPRAQPPPLASSSNTARQSASKPGACSTLAKSLLQVMPKNKHDKLLAFDKLRSKVKSVKAINTVCHVRVEDYQTASQNLKEEILRQNNEEIVQFKSGRHWAYVQEVQHKNNILKKILKHEWNTTISTWTRHKTQHV